MTDYEYTHFILQAKRNDFSSEQIDETGAYEISQLISGSITSLLYEALWVNSFEMESITQHLEELYDSKNYFGLIYFIIMLANAVSFIIPTQFTEMSVQSATVPILAASIIEDWLEYSTIGEISEHIG